MSLSRAECHERWSTANHDAYTEGEPRTHYLVELAKQYTDIDASVLELGCNVGRNLNGFLKAGYYRLNGVEINPNTKHHRQAHYPALAETATIHYMPIEAFLGLFEGDGFDLVYTMAVLEHIHPDSWAFVAENLHNLVKPGGRLITIEDEANHIGLDFVFARNYSVLGKFGFQLVMSTDADMVPGLKDGYVARVFKRPHG